MTSMQRTEVEIPETDKVCSGYLNIYAEIFKPFLGRKITLLELGVARGGSLLLWQDWFPDGTIIGIDKDLGPLVREPLARERVRCYEGYQDDQLFLTKIATLEGPFDIIIDDCSHSADPTRESFLFLFEYLKPDGLYCIEDWGTGYWDHPEFDGQRYQGPGHRAGMVGFVKELVDEVGMRDITDERFGIPPIRPSRFVNLTIYPGIVIVRKPCGS